MAVKIRLKRTGTTNAPSFRVVVADSASPRDGRTIDNLGLYNPRQEPAEIVINAERALHWLSQGAQPTETVRSLLKKQGILKQWKAQSQPLTPAE